MLDVFVLAFVRDHSIDAVDMRREAAQLDLLRLAFRNEPRVRVGPLHGHLNIAVRVGKNLKGTFFVSDSKRTWLLEHGQKRATSGDLLDNRCNLSLDLRIGLLQAFGCLVLFVQAACKRTKTYVGASSVPGRSTSTSNCQRSTVS